MLRTASGSAASASGPPAAFLSGGRRTAGGAATSGGPRSASTRVRQAPGAALAAPFTSCEGFGVSAGVAVAIAGPRRAAPGASGKARKAGKVARAAAWSLKTASCLSRGSPATSPRCSRADRGKSGRDDLATLTAHRKSAGVATTGWALKHEVEWRAALATPKTEGWNAALTCSAAPVQVEGHLPSGEQFYFLALVIPTRALA